MKPTAEDFVKLKRQVEELQRQHDRTAGAYAQILRELKKRFKCRNLKEAEALVAKLLKEEEELETVVIKQLKELRDDCPNAFPE